MGFCFRPGLRRRQYWLPYRESAVYRARANIHKLSHCCEYDLGLVVQLAAHHSNQLPSRLQCYNLGSATRKGTGSISIIGNNDRKHVAGMIVVGAVLPADGSLWRKLADLDVTDVYAPGTIFNARTGYLTD